MKTTLVILAILAAYAVSDALGSTSASISAYNHLHNATPKQRCLMAFEGTTHAQQCDYL